MLAVNEFVRMKEMVDHKLTELTEVFNRTVAIPQKTDTGEYRAEFIRHVKTINYSFFVFYHCPSRVREDALRQAGERLAQSGSIAIVCKVIEEECHSHNTPSELAEALENDHKVLKHAVGIIWCYSYSSARVAAAILESNLVPFILSKLRDFANFSMSWTRACDDNHPFVCIINNIAMHNDNGQRLRPLEALDVLLPYTGAHNEQIRLSALSAVANIARQEDTDLLVLDADAVGFLLAVVAGAVHGGQTYGWTLPKIVRAVRQLARNDANKRQLVSGGCLPLLAEGAKLLSVGNEEAKTECLGALWTLSLDQDNTQAFLDTDLLDLVASHTEDSVPPACRHYAEGILWQLRHELAKMPEQRWANLGVRRQNPQAPYWCDVPEGLERMKRKPE